MDSEDNGKGRGFAQVKETANLAKSLIRAALKGSLATAQKPSGHPYASLVLTATDSDGTPVFLISKLAVHTQNLQNDCRASLLIDATGAGADPKADPQVDTQSDPMQGARLTLIGEVHPTQSATARARFLARHPTARVYADFPDFGFYALRPERAHFIGGFGKIVDLAGGDLLLSLAGAEELAAAEPGIVAHMNADHADAILFYATKLLGAGAGKWRMAGIDPEGCDLVLGARGLRLAFGKRITSSAAARAELVRLVGVARGA
jgi:heme oxygenase (biliverdin-IX-beta and delta-forming)